MLYDTDFALGLIDSAFVFDGNGYVEVADHPSLALLNGRTAEAWIYPTGVIPNGSIIAKAENAAGHPPINWFVFYYGNIDNTAVFAINGTPNREISTDAGSVPYGSWTHIAATSDGTTMEIYADGVLQNAGPSPSLVSNPYSLLLGAMQRGGVKEQFFTGLIDEVSIYDRALIGSEIEAIFNAGSAGKCKTVIGLDIRPGVDPNRVDPERHTKVKVALLSAPESDATTADASAVTFGPGGAAPFAGLELVRDVDLDGDDDLVLAFPLADTGIIAGDTEACLTGATTSGASFSGCDAIQTER